MKFRTLSLFLHTRNSYSILKWPLFICSILIILTAFLLFLSFQSTAWFTFETGRIYGNVTLKNLQYGSFGLWKHCRGEQLENCETLARRTRYDNFNVITILTSCALFLVNICIFPSWAATILLFYNVNNGYIRYIVSIFWILLSLVLTFTCLLISMLIIVGLTKYYSPGNTILERSVIIYHTGPGIACALAATIVSIFVLMIIIWSLIVHKFMEIRLIEEEKELYRLITAEERMPSWHQVIRIPRNILISDEEFDQEPPPYSDSE